MLGLPASVVIYILGLGSTAASSSAKACIYMFQPFTCFPVSITIVNALSMLRESSQHSKMPFLGMWSSSCDIPTTWCPPHPLAVRLCVSSHLSTLGSTPLFMARTMQSLDNQYIDSITRSQRLQELLASWHQNDQQRLRSSYMMQPIQQQNSSPVLHALSMCPAHPTLVTPARHPQSSSAVSYARPTGHHSFPGEETATTCLWHRPMHLFHNHAAFLKPPAAPAPIPNIALPGGPLPLHFPQAAV